MALIEFEKYWISYPDYHVSKNGGKNIQTKFELNDVLSGLYVDDGLLAILRVFVEQARKKARISSLPYPEARRYALTKSATYVYRLVLDSLSCGSFTKDWWSKDNTWWIIVIRAFYLIKNCNYRRVIHHKNKKPAPLQLLLSKHSFNVCLNLLDS